MPVEASSHPSFRRGSFTGKFSRKPLFPTPIFLTLEMDMGHRLLPPS